MLNTTQYFSHSLEKPLLLSVVEDSQYPCPLGRGFGLLVLVDLLGGFFWRCGQFPSTIDKVFQLATSQLGTLDSENEGNSVHEVGLPSPIRTNNRGEVSERSYRLVAPCDIVSRQTYGVTG